MTKCILACCLMICSLMVRAQTFRHYTTTEQKEWQSTSAKLHGKAAATPLLIVTGQEKGHEFKAWGTCFNELGLDALLLLTDEEGRKFSTISLHQTGSCISRVAGLP